MLLEVLFITTGKKFGHFYNSVTSFFQAMMNASPSPLPREEFWTYVFSGLQCVFEKETALLDITIWQSREQSQY